MLRYEWGKASGNQSFSLANDYAKEKLHKLAVENVMVVESGGSEGVRESGRIDFSDWCQTLKKTKIMAWRPVTWGMTELRSVPYEIPAMYSLEQEEDVLANMYQRISVMKSTVCQPDVNAISKDWKKIGEDIDGAINTYGGQRSGKAGW